jgi:hypothetical protein
LKDSPQRCPRIHQRRTIFASFNEVNKKRNPSEEEIFRKNQLLSPPESFAPSKNPDGIAFFFEKVLFL